jgi:hypothetical protein
MRDITSIMDHYRIAARSLWNLGFWAVPELRSWDARDCFEEIKKSLFDALVASALSDAGSAETDIQVVPVGSAVPIMIEQPRPGDQHRNRYWDDPVDKISPSDAKLRYLDFFDWNKMAYADFHYYRVRIESFDAQLHLVGREALLEHQNARVFVD